MTKNIRQSLFTFFIVSVLLSVTTLNTFAASWHVSSYYRWTVQNACRNQIEVVVVYEPDESNPPPFVQTWYAYTWLDDGGPAVGPDPTLIDYAGDQISDYLETVDVTVEVQPKVLRYERSPGDWRKTNVWGKATIEWNTPVESQTGIFVTQSGIPWHSSQGMVIAAQNCGE